MKKYRILILCTVIFSVFLSSCTDETNSDNQIEEKSLEDNWVEIGALVDGEPVITGDKDALLESWNTNLLKLSGINGDFNDVYIDDTEGDYLLVFKGNQIQSSFYVELRNSSAFFAAGDTSCTTSDCSQENRGCVVKYDQGQPGYCSPCNNGGKCTKTTSNIAMISFQKI